MKLNMSNERLVSWGWAIGIIIFFSGFAISWCWEVPRSTGRRFQSIEESVDAVSNKVNTNRAEYLALFYKHHMIDPINYVERLFEIKKISYKEMKRIKDEALYSSDAGIVKP